MQVLKSSRIIGVWSVVVAIVAGLGVCGVSPVSAEEGTGNQVFFKGGYMNLSQDRGSQIFSDTNGLSGTVNGGNTGWYAGAGLDLVMSKNAWGAMDKTWVVGEIGLQFNRINSSTVNNTAQTLYNNVAGGSVVNPEKVQLTMMTINVAPKIKFMEGSAFRPWVIPIGLDFHVISPPSNQTQYLDLGLQFGGGFEFQVWKAFVLGVDARYHLTARMTNTNNDYFQVGPYVGISF